MYAYLFPVYTHIKVGACTNTNALMELRSLYLAFIYAKQIAFTHFTAACIGALYVGAMISYGW